MLIWWPARIFLLINPPQSNVDNNLGQIRMEQQSPLHPRDEAAQKPKRAIFPSLGGGEGAEKIFNLVCLRLKLSWILSVIVAEVYIFYRIAGLFLFAAEPAKRVFRLYKGTWSLPQATFGLYTGEGGGGGGPNLLSPVPCIPGSCPFFLGFLSDRKILGIVGKFPSVSFASSRLPLTIPGSHPLACSRN